MKFLQIVTGLLHETLTEATPAIKSQSALPRGRMRKSDDIKKLPEAMGIYRIKHRKTGLIEYIGQTNNLKRRAREHERDGRYKSIVHTIEYGIASKNTTRDDLLKTEKKHIKKHKPKQNKTIGGNGRR